ncbi:MAG: flagellar protein FliS [Candidatus Marinimicrobia bacterium]|nr:flagellar protein FliS [Candidatus Neomarinimicrobiota bacterium]
MLSNNMQRKSVKTNPYLVQKVLTASPEQLVVYIFDAAIIACGREDKMKASQAVQALINSLNFDSDRNIAVKFFQIYHYILNKINAENFDEAKKLLDELRKTWSEAMKVT